MKIIKQTRQKLKLTQKEFSEPLGVDASTVSYWESGLKFPRPDKIRLLGKIYKISLKDLYSS